MKIDPKYDRKFVCERLNTETGDRELHFFKAGHYWEISALNAFFHSLKRRNWHGSVMYREYAEMEWVRQKTYEADSIYSLSGESFYWMLYPPTVVHDRIYDFFDHIGYDRKTKKYLN